MNSSVLHDTRERSNRFNMLFGVRTRRGYQRDNLGKQNQDSYFAFSNFLDKKYMHLFGICDGHGHNGEAISNYLVCNFPNKLSQRLKSVGITTLIYG